MQKTQPLALYQTQDQRENVNLLYNTIIQEQPHSVSERECDHRNLRNCHTTPQLVSNFDVITTESSNPEPSRCRIPVFLRVRARISVLVNPEPSGRT